MGVSDYTPNEPQREAVRTTLEGRKKRARESENQRKSVMATLVVVAKQLVVPNHGGVA